MKNPIKILHIDPDYKVTYFIIREGSFIESLVPLEAAITLLKKGTFDLIISEPHNRAILNSQERPENNAPVFNLFLHPPRQNDGGSLVC